MDPEDSTTSDLRASPLHHLLLHSIVTSTLPVDRSRTFTACPSVISRTNVSGFLQPGQFLLAPTSDDCIAPFRDNRTVIVEAFERDTRDLQYGNFDQDVPVIGEYASIKDVSRVYTLNRFQRVAFALIALPLLSNISGIESPTQPPQLIEPSPVIVTGAGGTGKSQIIAAVRALASSWKRPESIMVVASTGIATASLNGCTMHSSVGLGINTNKLPKHIATPSDALLCQWAPVLCVIADEVSMVDLAFIGLWEEALRYAKESPDQPYGGLLTVLMFDHCQLRTVSGAQIYEASQDYRMLTVPQLRGRCLYRAITKVVYLRENMRFIQDPEWGQWLASGRLGNWTEGIRSFISTLPDFSITGSQIHPGLVQTISTDNITRMNVNATAIQIAVQSFGDDRNVYVIPARLSRAVSETDWKTIKALPDKKTGNIPVFLPIYIGERLRYV